jgi:adenylate cyclase
MEVLMADKSVHDLELELVKFQTQQDHLVKSVDTLQRDMKEVKVTLFQAKWMIVGALVVAGLMNSETLMQAIIGLAR